MADNYWEQTIEAFDGLIDKPPITEKYLKRPHIKYIVFVVGAVISKTGYGKGLYTKEEITNKNMTHEEQIDFLTKIINVVGLSIKKIVPVYPENVLKGTECDKTNIFLRMLAKAAKHKEKLPVPWKKAVEAVKAGKAPDMTAARRDKMIADKKKKQQQQQQQKQDDGDDNDEQEDNQGEEDNEEEEERRREAAARAKAEAKAKAEARARAEAKARAREEAEARERQEAENRARAEEEEEEARLEQERLEQEEREQYERAMAEEEMHRRAQEQMDNEHLYGSEPEYDHRMARRVNRPTTAGRKPPTNKTNIRDVTKDDLREKAPTGVILNDDDDDDDDGTVIIDDAKVNAQRNPRRDHASHNGGGGLVEHLKAQNAQFSQFENAPAEEEQVMRPRGGIILKKKTKSRSEDVKNELDMLRKNIQITCQSTNPLGKIMDYIQEDLDSMARELLKWNRERKIQAQRLSDEEAVTQHEMNSLTHQLQELDDQIADKRERILASKAALLQHDDTLNNLIQSVISSG